MTKSGDTENMMMAIGCIPLRAHPFPPRDQSPCVVEACPECNKSMWVSAKKRKLREANKLRCICLHCLALMTQGMDTEVVDINSIH